MDSKRIIRHTLPTKFDSAPFGTLCQVNIGDDDRQFYIQLSDSEEAKWEPLGFLMEDAFKEILEDTEFIEELLNLVRVSEYKSFDTIAEILKKKIIS